MIKLCASKSYTGEQLSFNAKQSCNTLVREFYCTPELHWAKEDLSVRVEDKMLDEFDISLRRINAWRYGKVAKSNLYFSEALPIILHHF